MNSEDQAQIREGSMNHAHEQHSNRLVHTLQLSDLCKFQKIVH